MSTSFKLFGSSELGDTEESARAAFNYAFNQITEKAHQLGATVLWSTLEGDIERNWVDDRSFIGINHYRQGSHPLNLNVEAVLA